jgi:hypothetical protein
MRTSRGHALAQTIAANIGAEPALPGEHALASRNKLAAAIAIVGGASFGCTMAAWVAVRTSDIISAYFLTVQDMPVLLGSGLFLLASVAAFHKKWASNWATAVLHAIDARRAMLLAAILVVIVCGAIWAGAHLIYQDFGLAVDEFMAEFDARIIARGHLLASVAPEWRDLVPALQPIFRLELPENAVWSSAYLPMNAAIRAIFVLLGAPALAGVVLAGLAIIAVFAVARRLWPDRPDAAVVATALLACSSQFVITAMTPYAMTAHLALNMIWLWLFLRDTRGAHALAAVAAFAACGLHQMIFHPLFAAPFIVSLLRARRWKLAGYYVAVYGAIGLFWVLYWTIVLHSVQAPMAQTADVGIHHFLERIAGMSHLGPGGIVFMTLNLLRFLAWQTPLIIPLAFVGLMAERDSSRTIIDLAIGMALTLVAMLVLMPFQGHGWGYRYLHGFLGGLALMAAQGWIRVSDRDEKASRTPALVLAASVVVSLVVVLPWQAYQVRALVTPYASAVAAIERAKADVVIVDPTDIWYGDDLVRNDPFLRTSPKVLALAKLDETQLGELCRRDRVAIFDRADAQVLGMRIVADQLPSTEHVRKLREFARSLRCGRPVLAGG